MKTKEWIVVVVAIIIIAVIVSLITSSITGNVIKLNQDKWGKYEVYTKAEIDAKLKNTITYQNLSKFFSSCNIYQYKGEYNQTLIIGTELCSIYRPGSICTDAEMFYNAYDVRDNSDWVTDTIGCGYTSASNWLKVLCCSP